MFNDWFLSMAVMYLGSMIWSTLTPSLTPSVPHVSSVFIMLCVLDPCAFLHSVCGDPSNPCKSNNLAIVLASLSEHACRF